jgi:hypothetical protein
MLVALAVSFHGGAGRKGCGEQADDGQVKDGFFHKYFFGLEQNQQKCNDLPEKKRFPPEIIARQGILLIAINNRKS